MTFNHEPGVVLASVFRLCYHVTFEEGSYESCLLRSSRPFMRIWISITASTDTLKGVSGVLRTGDAVLTSTSQSVSEWAGMGFDVLGSTYEHAEVNVMDLC